MSSFKNLKGYQLGESMARGEGWVGVVFRQLHGSGYIILRRRMRGLFPFISPCIKTIRGSKGGRAFLA
jgi:hypothetical protein